MATTQTHSYVTPGGRQLTILDADGHVMEKDAELFPYLPPPYAGQRALLVQPAFFPSLDGYNRSARRIADGGTRAPEEPTAEAWLQFLAEAGLEGTVLYPTQGLAFGLIKDREWAVGLARAYNDWLYDRYVRVDRRLHGMALIPLQDPPAAVAELRRAVEQLGFLGAILPAVGLRPLFGSKVYWPVYEAAQELDCLLTVHAAATQGLGLDDFDRLIEVRTLSHGFGQMRQMVHMMYGGVFDAFPRLRVAYCEAGCGWVPYLLERLDLEYANRGGQAPDLKVPPSEHLRSGRVFVHAELEEQELPRAVEVLGEDVFFCASDYPHEPPTAFPKNLALLAARQDLPDSFKRKILWDNPLRMYAFDEADLLDAAQTPASAAGTRR